eukprot:167945_1
MAAYNTTMVKVKAYLETKSVKAVKACNKAAFGVIVLKYDIRRGEPLLPRHLVALFFYTDFTDLCTHFSRYLSCDQAIRAVIDYQSTQFTVIWTIDYQSSYRLSKSLRELVELYGDARVKS